jgi:trehalose 6-phosphate synthase
MNTDELDGALIVNPYDIEAVAEALHRGLIMPLDERQDRWRRLLAQLQQHDVMHWRRNFVDALAQELEPTE